jgi:hypothetical protein
MTDNLSNKFADTNQLMVTHHGEIMAALDAIAFSLGATPPAGMITLADVQQQLILLNATLAQLAAQLTIAQVAQAETLGLINVNVETMLANNATNTQYLLAAIAANDPCKPCDTPIYQLPPSDTTISAQDIEHCKRMQALIYALLRFSVKIDVLSSFGYGFSTRVISDAFNEVITELGVPELLLLPSALEVAAIVGAALNYVASNIFSSTNLPHLMQTLGDSLLTSLYDTDSANAGMQSYRNVINGADMPSSVKQLFIAMGYTSLFNLYYDRTKMLSLGAYDGTICAPAEVVNCITIHAPTDPFTRDNGGYCELNIQDYVALRDRLTGDSTVEVSVQCEMAINRFNFDLIAPNTPTLLSSLRYRTYITSHNPAASMTITFCNILPAAS